MKPPVTTPLCALLLDDDALMSELIGEMLAQFGMPRIFLESNPHHALTKLMEQQPELLICDLAIPEMDGFEFLKNIGKTGYQGGIIVLSGLSAAVLKAANNLAQSHGLRVLGAFEKPLRPADLQQAISLLHAPPVANS